MHTLFNWYSQVFEGESSKAELLQQIHGQIHAEFARVFM
jgi:hypothetical protein